MSFKARRISGDTVVQTFTWGRPESAGAGPGGAAQAARPAAAARQTGASGATGAAKGAAAGAATAMHVPADDVDDGARQQRLAALERDAFAKGFAQGERAGQEAAEQRAEAMVRRLTDTLQELTQLRAQMIRQTERQMVQLSLAVARRIIHHEVSIDHDLLVAMARVALDRLGDAAQVTVRLHPDDFQATGAARVAPLTASNVSVVADGRIARGGCRVESDLGIMEAGIDAQIQEIAQALLGRDPAAPAGLVVDRGARD